MSISVFEHPWLSALLGDREIARHFTGEAELQAMLRFEVALAKAEADLGLIPAAAAESIAAAAQSFQPDIARLAEATARDGVVVPEWVNQLRKAIGAPHDRHLHFASTSQDVIDTALILRLKDCVAILESRLGTLIDRLDGRMQEIGSTPLMAHTRLQRALPITWADKIQAWRAPLARHRERLRELKSRLLVIQLGGPTGTLDALGTHGPAVVAAMARELGLGAPMICWHTARDGLAEFAGWLSLLTGSVGKIGQDVGLLAQSEVGAVTLARGGRSSAMPHKSNPVSAEILVTLARFNAAQLAVMHGALLHEQERSGAAWTLEWMILPQMTAATGAALARCTAVIDEMQIDQASGNATALPE
jgi:3-carboxy-cis,cis-muconate cycloisomerase